MCRTFNFITIGFLALPLAACISTTATFYKGEIELDTVSGSGCIDAVAAGSRIPLNLTLEQKGSSNGQQQIDGYFKGTDIQTGHFFGTDLSRLQVVYPDETSSAQGNTLKLVTTSGGVNGELHEKPQADSTNCYFEKAALKLKLESTGSEAKEEHGRQSKLFKAGEYYIRGQLLLKADKPNEAIRNFTESLKLRNKVNIHDPDKAYPAVSLAIAYIMAGQDAEALSIMHDLLREKSNNQNTRLELRVAISNILCNGISSYENEEVQKASGQLIDAMAREFGSLNGIAINLAKCYRELGEERKEQNDPDLAIKFFKKAVKLNPNDPGGIAGVVISFVDKEDPADGLTYLQDHAQIFIEKAGKENYDTFLSILYATEAHQAEIGGNLPSAEQKYREALKFRPGEQILVIKLSRVLRREAKSTEARTVLVDGSKSCTDTDCRKVYDDELTRQELIEWMVKRIEAESKKH